MTQQDSSCRTYHSQLYQLQQNQRSLLPPLMKKSKILLKSHHTLPSAPFPTTDTFPPYHTQSSSPRPPQGKLVRAVASSELTASPRVPDVSPSKTTCSFNDCLKDVLICTSLLYSASNTCEICRNFSMRFPPLSQRMIDY